MENCSGAVCVVLCVCRNVETILAERGEGVSRGDDRTVEVCASGEVDQQLPPSPVASLGARTD